MRKTEVETEREREKSTVGERRTGIREMGGKEWMVVRVVDGAVTPYSRGWRER